MGDRGTPRLTADEVIAIGRRSGFALVGSAGRHQKWRNDSTTKQVIVPYCRGRILPLGAMKAILSRERKRAGTVGAVAAARRRQLGGVG